MILLLAAGACVFFGCTLGGDGRILETGKECVSDNDCVSLQLE